ncbi:uncharacterized protein N7482_007216 [Penicillium canariense]|uniref:Ribosome biogenesis protein Alb1 n=1 Tax=Penicillium canariense TaxID=189055 RepID=A0A9W9HZ80_9EURO|nr:uncharacterized protein N7482_007216 [Penicillium canariense]KAJ5160212.1 hypothetical protein N7482_007216 [Penicillium canariense]
MAKNKPKTNNSRAARRGASPSLDLDKSLTSLPRVESSPSTQRPTLLADRATAGVQKKRKGKNLTKAQRLRQQKGMDRAEAVMDQLEIKKAKSFVRAKIVNERRADWEDTNKKTSILAALQQNEEAEEDDDDDNDDDAMTTEKIEPAKPTTNVLPSSNLVAAESVPADEYDEIT